MHAAVGPGAPVPAAGGSGRRGFGRNASSAYGVRLALGLNLLLVTPILFRALGPEGFGTWSVMFTIAAVAGLLENGLLFGIAKVVAELDGRDHRADLERTVCAAVGMAAAAGLLIGVVLAAAGLAAAELAPVGQRAAFQLGLLAMAAATALRVACSPYGAVLIGRHRHDLANLPRLLEVPLFALGALAALSLGWGVLGVALAYACASAFTGLLQLLVLARFDRMLPLGPRLADGAARRRLARVAPWVVLVDSMRFTGQNVDPVVIAALRGAVAAAPFAAVVKLQSALQSLTLPLAQLVLPIASDLGARGGRADVARLLAIACRVSLQVTLPVAAALALFSGDVVALWLGSQAPAVTATILAILMVAQTLSLTAIPAEQVLIGLGRARSVGVLAAFEGLGNLVVSIALVSAYGAVGAAVGSLCAAAVFAPLRIPLACRALGCRPLGLVRASLAPAVTASLPGLAVMVAAWALLPPGTVRLAAGMGCGVLLCLAVALIQIGPRALLSVRHGLPAPRSAAVGQPA